MNGSPSNASTHHGQSVKLKVTYTPTGLFHTVGRFSLYLVFILPIRYISSA